MDQNPIPQQYNSPAGSQMGAFEAGDIVLPPSEPVKNNSKPKIWLLVLIGVLVLAGAGFLIYNTVIKSNNENNNPQDSEKVSDVAEAKQRFNVYANYLLYGKDEVNEDPKVISHLENYDAFNPQGIFAETADKDTLEKIEVRFREFLNIYDKYYFTALSLERYFYTYLISDKTTANVNEIKLRVNAVDALMAIYTDIYNIDLNNVEGGSANE